jgi:phosphate transport system substrate-binding protein
MTKISRLTPFSRVLLSVGIVASVLFLLKTLLQSPKTGEAATDSTTLIAPSGAEAILRLSGSSTLGAKMMPQLAADFMRNELKATAVNIQKVSETEAEIVAEMPNGKQQMITISTSGSAQGITDLENKKADIALFSGITDALNPALNISVIALDGIAIIVHNSNKIKELSKAQVADIFSGKTTDWAQVGGSAGKINCFARDAQSGTSEAFKQLIFENIGMALPTSIAALQDSKALVAAVENDPNAIGFTSFSAIGNAQALGLSDAGTTVRYPSVFTIQTEDYLLTRRLFMITESSSTGNNAEMATRFLAYCNTDEKGQKIVASTGFVNMDLHNAAVQTVVVDAPPAYLAATSGAKRLPTTLHFQSGTAKPDVRATADLKRIMQILSTAENRQKQILLIGFTDNVGNPTQNIALSTQRATNIQTEFAKFGVQTQTFGFGQALPIANNTSAAGQNKNRRVEVWLQ